MAEAVALLMVQFLSWVRATRPMPSNGGVDSHCPRHTIWEDAQIDGWSSSKRSQHERLQVVLTPRGRALLNGNLSGQPIPV